MQSVMICEACESGQVCKLKEDGFVDLCPKKSELSKGVKQNKNQLSSRQRRLDTEAVYKKGTDRKRKKRQK